MVENLHFFAVLPTPVFPLNLMYESWSSKTRVHGLRQGGNRMILRLLVLTQYQRVTDRQTDGTLPIAKSHFSYIAERNKKRHEVSQQQPMNRSVIV